jgi:Asp-tRNA(Asn)/Glu-tRNA(Gln) amidotransferase A subunit family amidase
LASVHFRAVQSERSPVPLRFAFVRTPVWDKADADTKAAFERLAAGLGASSATVDLPESMIQAWQVHRTIMAAEMAHNLAPLIGHGEPSEVMRKLLAHGRSVSAVDYLAALAKPAQYRAAITELFDEYDAIITPAAPGVAPQGLSATGDPTFCTLWTLTGLPAVALPLLTGEGGLPLGVQLVGAPGQDACLLRTAGALVAMLSAAEQPGRRAKAK